MTTPCGSTCASSTLIESAQSGECPRSRGVNPPADHPPDSGWGLPLLERRRLRDFIKHEKLASMRRRLEGPPDLDVLAPPPVPEANTPKHDLDMPEQPPKRQCVKRTGTDSSTMAMQLERRARPWKVRGN